MLTFALLGAEWVLWLLVGLSILCVGVALERIWYLRREAGDKKTLEEAVERFLDTGDLAALQQTLSTLGGAGARMLNAAVVQATTSIAGAAQTAEGVRTVERMQMEKGLLILATVGSNAPFIGLFGTVLGIIRAFHDLSIDTGDASEAVMAGISEALVATAVGLLVAIPAVVLYNVLMKTVKHRLSRADSLMDLVLGHLQTTER
jgi:biopolymer transport protein ExbB